MLTNLEQLIKLSQIIYCLNHLKNPSSNTYLFIRKFWLRSCLTKSQIFSDRGCWIGFQKRFKQYIICDNMLYKIIIYCNIMYKYNWLLEIKQTFIQGSRKKPLDVGQSTSHSVSRMHEKFCFKTFLKETSFQLKVKT